MSARPNTQAPILALNGITRSFGALKASDDVHLDVTPGELHAVIGPNGAGKTTLVAQICGQLLPDAGTVRFDGRDITALPDYERAPLGLARSYQITSIFPDFTVLQNALLAVQMQKGRSFRLLPDKKSHAELEEAAMTCLETVGLDDMAATPAAAMSYGQKRHLELAMALALKPKMLVLDEPLAGMGPRESEGIVNLLRSMKGSYSILLVEHDMDAVFALADRISVLVYGRVIACDTPDRIRADQSVRDAYLGEEAPC